VSTSKQRRTIAVVGGGIAGITAAHLLASRHEVTLYEAAPRLGGHARALTIASPDQGEIQLDTAFLIFNERHYPLFMRFVKELGLEQKVVRAEMSASFSDDIKGFHYALNRGLFAAVNGGRNLVKPGFFRIFIELFRFRKKAHSDLTSGRLGQTTLHDYIRGYSPLFRENFVLPLASCIWSLPPEAIRAYPASAILSFFDNHELLAGISGRHWRTFAGSSRIYVDAFCRKFPGTIRLGSRIDRIQRDADGVRLQSAAGAEYFDSVVIATHADTALALLADASARERQLLEPWVYQPNRVVLHTDRKLLHPDRRLWASWNYRVQPAGATITYWLNRVQPIPSQTDYFLSLSNQEVEESHILDTTTLRHPVFSLQSVGTQTMLPSLNGRQHTYFCGSYFGFGFHEDAVRSATAVATLLNERRA
jgi:predicted NAD/FAD-binding protein